MPSLRYSAVRRMRNLTHTLESVEQDGTSNTNGASMTYTYDVLNRLATVTDNRIAGQGGPSSPTTYSYDPTGNLTGYVYPNTVQTAKLFDPLNRLTQTCSAATSPACSAGTKLFEFRLHPGAGGEPHGGVRAE